MASLLGKTIARPLRLSGRSDIETSTGVFSVKQAIETLVLTNAANPSTGEGGDRVFNRSVGINILKFLFVSDSPTARAALKQEILKIREFEPRIIFSSDDVTIDKDPLDVHKWIVKISFQILQTGAEENHVIPLFRRERFNEVL